SKIVQQNSTPAVNGISTIHTQAHASGLQQVPPLVPPGPGGEGKAVPPSKQSKRCPPMDRNSDEYCQGREGQHALRPCLKEAKQSKRKIQDTPQRVNQLKEENERLEEKITFLTKELSVLKDLFLEHLHNLADNVQLISTETTTTNSDPAGQ
ncbi:CCAAT/enhancer-binding protein gamma, partial [Heterocephalus glaber]